MSEHHSAVNSALGPFSAKPGPGHITLESLLDSPGLTPPSPLSESVGDLGMFDNGGGASSKCSNIPSHPTSNVIQEASSKAYSMSETQRQVFLRDVCVELLCILRSQDVNGYFLSSVPALGVVKGHNRVGLLDIERRVFSNNYHCFSDYQNDVMTLLSGAMAYHPDGSHIHAEAQRLFTLASDWFASIHPDQLQLLNTGPLKTQPQKAPATNASGASSIQQEGEPRSVTPRPLTPEAYLGVLNPDNHGVVSQTERIQSIGDEVGQLKSGSYLLPNGGYREDRRNKVIPYTYLDYGPYYSFAPRYDSGASHCSPEANELILSTSWLPARTAFLSKTRKASPPPSPSAVERSDVQDDDDNDCDDEITRAVQSDAVCSALDAGDHQLAVSLAVIEMERQSTAKLAAELDMILPGPEVSDDCVFGMCLANALTRNILLSEEPGDKTDQQKSETFLALETPEVPCDLDQSESSTPGNTTQQELTESANDLRALYHAQYRRLGDTSQSASTAGTTLHPTPTETAIAHRLAGRLVDLAKRVKPRDLVHPYAVRRAMGMQPELYALPDTLEDHVSAYNESAAQVMNTPVG